MLTDEVLGGNPSLLYPAIAADTRYKVNCIAPGMVFTPMVRGRGMTDEMRQARIKQNLMGREGTGWDVGYGRFPPVHSPYTTDQRQPFYSSAARRRNGSLVSRGTPDP